MTSKDKLFALINASNPLVRPLTPNNVEIINPRLAVGTGYNTRATVRALPDRGYTREQDVFYRRIDLSVLAPVQYSIEEISTPSLLLARLNARRGTWLELEDVLAFTMPNVPQGGSGTVTLTAADESYGFIGQVVVTLTRAVIVPSASVATGARSVSQDANWPFTQRFTVTLSQPSATSVSVGIRTVDGAGGAADDAYDPRLELLTFTPGELTKHLDVATQVNFSGNPQNFSVLLSDATGCTIGTATAQAVIPVQTIRSRLSMIGPVDLGAGLNQVRFKCILTREYPGLVDVTYGTVNGSAIDGTDYAGAAGVWHFAVDETEKEVIVDYVRPPAGTLREFTFTISGPNGAVINTPTANFTIPESENVEAVVTLGEPIVERIVVVPPPLEVEITNLLYREGRSGELTVPPGGSLLANSPDFVFLATGTRQQFGSEDIILQRQNPTEESGWEDLNNGAEWDDAGGFYCRQYGMPEVGPSYYIVEPNTGTDTYRLVVRKNGVETFVSQPATWTWLGNVPE
ncbi:Calx-beta domain protein [compost metagenome]